MEQEHQAQSAEITMQRMFMEHPVGSSVHGEEVKGYRQMMNKSALLLGDGSWEEL